MNQNNFNNNYQEKSLNPNHILQNQIVEIIQKLYETLKKDSIETLIDFLYLIKYSNEVITVENLKKNIDLENLNISDEMKRTLDEFLEKEKNIINDSRFNLTFKLFSENISNDLIEIKRLRKESNELNENELKIKTIIESVDNLFNTYCKGLKFFNQNNSMLNDNNVDENQNNENQEMMSIDLDGPDDDENNEIEIVKVHNLEMEEVKEENNQQSNDILENKEEKEQQNEENQNISEMMNNEQEVIPEENEEDEEDEKSEYIEEIQPKEHKTIELIEQNIPLDIYEFIDNIVMKIKQIITQEEKEKEELLKCVFEELDREAMEYNTQCEEIFQPDNYNQRRNKFIQSLMKVVEENDEHIEENQNDRISEDVKRFCKQLQKIIEKYYQKEDYLFIKKEMKYMLNDMKEKSKHELDDIYENVHCYYQQMKIDTINDIYKKFEYELQEADEIVSNLQNETRENEERIIENEKKIEDLQNQISPNGKLSKEKADIERRQRELRERVSQEDAQHLQYINIPFENWYLERKHRVFIRLDDNRRLTCTIDITHQRKNGEIVKINDNIQLVLNFTHRYYRREGDDIIYYMRENEIHKEYRDSVRHPNGSSFGYSYNDFKNNEIIVEGFGFRDQNGKSGRFIIRKISENQEIPMKEHAIVSHRQENEREWRKLIYQYESKEREILNIKKLIDELIKENWNLKSEISQSENELIKWKERKRMIEEELEKYKSLIKRTEEETIEIKIDKIFQIAEKEERLIKCNYDILEINKTIQLENETDDVLTYIVKSNDANEKDKEFIIHTNEKDEFNVSLGKKRRKEYEINGPILQEFEKEIPNHVFMMKCLKDNYTIGIITIKNKYLNNDVKEILLSNKHNNILKLFNMKSNDEILIPIQPFIDFEEKEKFSQPQIIFSNKLNKNRDPIGVIIINVCSEDHMEEEHKQPFSNHNEINVINSTKFQQMEESNESENESSENDDSSDDEEEQEEILYSQPKKRPEPSSNYEFDNFSIERNRNERKDDRYMIDEPDYYAYYDENTKQQEVVSSHSYNDMIGEISEKPIKMNHNNKNHYRNNEIHYGKKYTDKKKKSKSKKKDKKKKDKK